MLRAKRSLQVLVGVGLTLACLLWGGWAWALDEVTVNDDFFAPDQVTATVGETVHWSRGTGNDDHNVRQDDLLFRSGAPTDGPIDYSVDFSAGTYHYYCEVHGSEFGGMDGIVKSPVKITDPPTGLKFTVTWAAEGTDTGSVYDVQYRIGSGVWKNWRTDTSLLSGVFGQNGSPVAVQADKTYRFRARSQEGNAVSGWSPIKTKNT